MGGTRESVHCTSSVLLANGPTSLCPLTPSQKSISTSRPQCPPVSDFNRLPHRMSSPPRMNVRQAGLWGTSQDGCKSHFMREERQMSFNSNANSLRQVNRLCLSASRQSEGLHPETGPVRDRPPLSGRHKETRCVCLRVSVSAMRRSRAASVPPPLLGFCCWLTFTQAAQTCCPAAVLTSHCPAWLVWEMSCSFLCPAGRVRRCR